MDTESEFHFEILGERSATSSGGSDICFDDKNGQIYCANGSYLMMYNMETGVMIRRFPHESRIVGIHFGSSSLSPPQVVSCTLDKQLHFWCAKTGKLLKEINIEIDGVLQFSSLVKHPENYLLLISEQSDSCTNLFGISLSSCKSSSVQAELLLKSVPSERRRISFGNGYVVHVNSGGNDLVVRELKTDNPPQLRHSLYGNRLFVSVACHPERDAVAAGDSSGRILIWENASGSLGAVSQMMHWQTMPVTDLVWSPQGSSIFSGGRERVLVKYTLHHQGKWTRSFLPRLGSAITRLYCSNDGSCLAVFLEDNSVQLVSNQLEMVTSIEELLKNTGSGQRSAGMVCDLWGVAGSETIGTIWMNGRPGQLQCYSPSDKITLFSLDVTGLNVPPEEREGVTQAADVSHFALSSKWLATVESETDPIFGLEQMLKFWIFNSESGKFELNTCIEQPHSNQVSSLGFAKTEPRLVSTGLDGRFRLWTLLEESSVFGEAYSWACVRVGGFRNLVPVCCSISWDESVLAVGFQRTLTVWNFSDFAALSADFLPTSAADDSSLRQMVWGRDSCDHLIACSTDEWVVVWNTETVSSMWKVKEPHSLLCLDPLSGILAWVGHCSVSFCPLNSPDSLIIVEGDRSTKLDDALSAVFVPDVPFLANASRNSIPSKLFIHSSAGHLIVCSSRKETIDRSEGRVQIEELTPFTNLLVRTKTEKQAGTANFSFFDHKANVQLLAGPAHTLPSLDVLGPRFLKSCLLKKTD